MISITPDHLEELLARAAEVGAKRALDHVGLHDENAAEDMRELRSVLDGWRAAKSAALKTVVQMLVTGLMVAMVAGLAITVWNKK
jgi:predicted DNA-binding protein (UPF0251 family)